MNLAKLRLIYLGHIVGGGELKIDPSKVKVNFGMVQTQQCHRGKKFFGSSPILVKVYC